MGTPGRRLAGLVLGATCALAAHAAPASAHPTTLGLGANTSCGITAGALNCWGYGGSQHPSGTMREGSVNPAATLLRSGVTDVAMAATGGGFVSRACAVASGAAKCWGSGPLGNGTDEVSSAFPRQVTGLTSGVTAVDTGSFMSCAIQRGLVKCWGGGEFGDGGANRTSKVPVTAAGITGATDIAVGRFHQCALAQGVVYCWGGLGRRGTVGHSGSTTVPTPVENLGGVATKVAAGGETSCAIVAGGAKCWGYNGSGLLGSGPTPDATQTPTPVTGMTSGVTQIAMDSYGHACAIQLGGVKCWGDGNRGALGDGNTDPHTQATPVVVPGLFGMRSIAVGNEHTCAEGAAGRFCWGSNFYGEAGNEAAGPFTGRPAQVVGSLPNQGRTFVAAPVSGTVTVKCGRARARPLRDFSELPKACTIDATRGRVDITTARNSRGATQTLRLSLGAFRVAQRRGRALTEIALAGRAPACGARASASRRKRRLFGSGRGVFRTKGRYGSATVRGTKWLTEDRCNGTFVRVTEGVVAVRAFRLGRTVLVRAGRSFLAPARRR